MRYRIVCPSTEINASVKLPTSKSISNRMLIIKALAEGKVQIHNLSESEDTRVMEEAFKLGSPDINVGHAGTAMRFLTAYLSVLPGEWRLTGSERMKNRPIQKLVDALRILGANIEYSEKLGYPPLKIIGGKLNGGSIEIDGSISSQYISALLMIAPLLPGGLKLKLINSVISSSYIRLTLGLMEKCGIRSSWIGGEIEIAEQNYHPADITVEADWSAASYWYEIAALAEKAEIFVEGLTMDSLQGDSAIYPLFELLGVGTEFVSGGALLRKTKILTDFFEYDFIESPDMVQTFAVSLSLLGIPFRLSGCQSLRIKETDRVTALQTELFKLGAKIIYEEAGILRWDGKDKLKLNQSQLFATYQDHRMALAFTPVCLRTGEVFIDDPAVVAKSYPTYWKELENLGFKITESV